MSIFSNLPKKEDKIMLRKTFKIDEIMYERLKYLSDNIYDASINKLVILAIEDLIKTENIKVYSVDSKNIDVERTFLIKESLMNNLENLSIKYKISMYKLINIAINNALENE
ncbi:MAG: hypothetical protein N2749_05545 [Clostridia bacterium]|nr:hypothetical protein [Clostridia bacterium]